MPVILAVIAPVLLYLPPVQDFAVKYAGEKLSETTGMKISVEKLRLKFPLRLSVENVEVIEQSGDTMLLASAANTSLKVMPLLHGDLDVNGVELREVFYQMGNADSLMWLRANVKKADISESEIALKLHTIDLGRAEISGVKVHLAMRPDTVETPSDTAKSAPWRINASELLLSDVEYSMSMAPTIDYLSCKVPSARLSKAKIDLGAQAIHAVAVSLDSVTAKYLYPAATPEPATTEVAEADENEEGSSPWTIRVDSVHLSAINGLYALSGYSPAPGFDANFIQVSGVEIDIDSLYNRGADVTVPIRNLKLTERCGLPVSASGRVKLEGGSVYADGISLSTLRSTFNLSGMMGLGNPMTDPTLPMRLQGSALVAPLDIVAAMPGMRAMLAPFGPTALSIDIDGTPEALNVYRFDINSPRLANVHLNGMVENPFDPKAVGGNLSINGSLSALTDREFSFLPIPHTPALKVEGNVNYHPGSVEGDFNITTHGGRMAGMGSWTASSKEYDAKVKLDRFPVHLFMPSLGLRDITAAATVEGRGYDPMKASTAIDVDVNLHSAHYQGREYQNIILNTSLHAGEASGKLVSHNPGADGNVGFEAYLAGDTVEWDLSGDIRDLDLKALHLTDSVNEGRFRFETNGWFNIATQGFDAQADLSSLLWRSGSMTINPMAPVLLDAKSDWNGSDIRLSNSDLAVKFKSPSSAMNFISQLTPAIQTVTAQIDSMKFDAATLNAALPSFNFSLTAGQNNILSNILAQSGMAFGRLNATASNDSILSMNMTANRVMAGGTMLDSVHLDAVQHGNILAYNAAIENKPGTFDDFAHVTVSGYAGDNRASLFLKQRNIQGENGFTFGINASVADSVVTARFMPYTPTIAYKPWSLNPDNFVSYNLASGHIDANLSLTGENSFIKLYTIHSDDAEAIDSLGHHEQEDLMVELSRVKLQDWLSINPFAPPVKGDLSANMRIGYNDKILTGKGTVSLADLIYGSERVGTFDLDVDVANSPDGKVMADLSLMVDSVKAMTAYGVVNDSTQRNPFMIDFNLIQFPLKIANPFIPEGMAVVGGVLNGAMKVSGTPSHPVFDGHIAFDSATVKVPMMGTTFKLSDTEIPVDSGVVHFNDFLVYGCNNNPLSINGVLDARKLTDMAMNLDLNARNIQVVKSDRPRGADMFGKAFLDLSAKVKGNMSLLNVKADVAVLENTNVTYILSSGEQSITERNTEDMVHFVQFNDTLKMLKADSLSASGAMMLDLAAALHIKEGAAFTVYISPDGVNRAYVQPSGDLDFTMSPLNGDRLTGRLNINEGFVRYTPQFLSEKNFAFNNNSYVMFNGDMLNPVLNIHAVDVMRANVTQSGQNSRLVNFDVILNVTNTLDDMNVSFDLSTNDDITVQNELAAMTAEQRANQAMNLLAYNVYAGPGTKATANLSGNPLYSFLASTLNTWAANNIRGVDISFGVDQYNKTYEGNTSTAMSYSYRVSKSLFNDRFKIVIGGNYSTDANADENFSQNLINDISFEYLLNRSGSMYVRVFRHTGYESILEGEITQTGVGFVLKRKLNSLGELVGIKRD